MAIRTGTLNVEALIVGQNNRVGGVGVEALLVGQKNRVSAIRVEALLGPPPPPVVPNPPNSLSVLELTSTTTTILWYEDVAGEPPVSFEYSMNGSAPVDVGLDNVVEFEGLSPESTYVFRVRTVAASGVSDWAELSFTTTEGAPPPPFDLILFDITNQSVEATWNRVYDDDLPEITGFEYQVVGYPLEVATSGATTRGVGGLNSLTDYVFRIRSTGFYENSEWVEIPFTTLGPPTSPTELTVTEVTGTQARITWTAPPTADRYQYQLNSEGITDLLTPGTTILFEGLPPEGNHRFDVRALNDYGMSSWTSVYFSTLVGTPEPPIGVQIASSDSTSFTANWLAPSTGSPPTNYQYRFDGGDWVDLPPEIMSVTIYGLPPGTSHTLNVRSKNEAGTSTWDHLAFELDPGPAHPPANVTAYQITQTGATIKWDTSLTGPAPIRYEYSLDFSAVLSSEMIRQVFLESLTPGSTHSFRVRAVGEYGTSDWVEIVFTTLPPDYVEPETNRLKWHKLGEKFYENGLDRGVLYLEDGTGIAWNGLSSLEEDMGDESTEPLYFDGVKYLDAMSLGTFSGTLRAIIYPDEFMEYEGFAKVGTGVYADDQNVKVFGLSYRTLIGNDVQGDEFGYKLHLVYNLTATLDTRSRVTLGDSPSLTEFGWTVNAVPQGVPNYRPTAHVMIDSRRINKSILKSIEDILYGDGEVAARLPTIAELVDFVANYTFVEIFDNGDGTWTARGPDEMIEMIDETTFVIHDANAVYLDEDTYRIKDT